MIFMALFAVILAGCATTDEPMSEKEKAKLDREMQKNSRQLNQNLEKNTRSANPTRSRR